MQEAVPVGHGAMTAVLGMTINEVEKEISLLPKQEICEIANDNSIGQVVVSGTKTIIETLNNNNLISNLLIAMILVILVGLIYALFISPPDYIQGDSVRIMYVHVPASFIALGCFGFIGIASILNLVFKIKFMSLMAKSLAPVGCIFSLVSIVTGSLWGKPTWGTWWAWDARITSMLILALFYSMYLLSWRIFENKEQVIKITSIIAILGAINIPIIKFSVDWWSTLHQGASITILSKTSIHSSMLIPLAIMTAAFALFSLLIFLMKYNTELIKIKNKGLDRL